MKKLLIGLLALGSITVYADTIRIDDLKSSISSAVENSYRAECVSSTKSFLRCSNPSNPNDGFEITLKEKSSTAVTLKIKRLGSAFNKASLRPVVSGVVDYLENDALSSGKCVLKNTGVLFIKNSYEKGQCADTSGKLAKLNIKSTEINFEGLNFAVSKVSIELKL